MVRHGETQWNREQRLQGQLDSPLTSNGIQQIESLGEKLIKTRESHSIDQIITSPLNRAQHSAKILAKQLSKPLSCLDELKERSFGVWEGQLFDEIKGDSGFSDVFFKVNNTVIPNGESAVEARKRMTAALRQLIIQFPQKKLLVVTHGELLRCFLSGVENNIDGSAYELFKNGQIFEVHFSPHNEQFKLVVQ